MSDTATQAAPPFELRHRIARAMEHAGITAAELGEEVGRSEGTIRNWTSGRVVPSRGHIAAIALRCNVSVAWLRDGEDPDPDGPGSSQYAPWDSNPEPAD